MDNYKVSCSDDIWCLPCDDRIDRMIHVLVAFYTDENQLSPEMNSNIKNTITGSCSSVSEKLDLLEAMLRITNVAEHTEILKEIQGSSQLQSHYTLPLHLITLLIGENANLAANIFYTCLEMFPSICKLNKGFLCQIILSQIWSPLEAMRIAYLGSLMEQTLFTGILHKAQTYFVTAADVEFSLQDSNPFSAISEIINRDEDKPLELILEEMRDLGYSENEYKRLTLIIHNTLNHSCLHFVDDALQQKRLMAFAKAVKCLDCCNPDCEKLAIILSTLIACIQTHTTEVLADGVVIQGYKPRITQLVALIILLVSKNPNLNGCLLEICTGEGKSCIIAMLAVIFAIQGKHVDIMTSSAVLAIRDSQEWTKFYETFDISCSVIPPQGLDSCTRSEERQKLQIEAYEKHIVYGTVGDFAADLLTQKFNKYNVRGCRKLDVAIVDEVDLMTLDNGIQVTYLSHSATGLQHIEQILATIWMLVCTCRPVLQTTDEDPLWVTHVQHFHSAILATLPEKNSSVQFTAFDVLKYGIKKGFFTKSEFQKFISKEKCLVNEDQSQKYVTEFMSRIGPSKQMEFLKIVEKAMNKAVQFTCYTLSSDKLDLYSTTEYIPGSDVVTMLLLDNGLASELLTYDELIKATVVCVRKKIVYSNNVNIEKTGKDLGEEYILVPSFLKEYVENRMPIFVGNALKAILMTKDREYMIDHQQVNDDFFTAGHRHYHDAIIPVDFKASGVLEKNKKWGDGLQQFLEMKHQLAISPLSTVTNFMSNFHLFQCYSKSHGVYGVTGTIGEQSACKFLSKHFKTHCYQIPTHRRKKLIELPAFQVKGEKSELLDKICQRIHEITEPKGWGSGQAVLVVCEDMKTTIELKTEITDRMITDDQKIFMYTRSDKHKVEDRVFKPGDIIIATNLGGRGTDLYVDDQVNESGGLFVLLTHFSANKRVEKQAFGRTARNGKPGMAQIILSQNSLAVAYKGENIDTMRKLRATFEEIRIETMEDDELATLIIRESLFQTFCKHLDMFHVHFKENRDVDPKPALQAFKETWAQWLILNEKVLDNITFSAAQKRRFSLPGKYLKNRSSTKVPLSKIKSDLREVLHKRAEELKMGKSNNIYDFIHEAMNCIDKHAKNHQEEQKSWWHKAAEIDNAYRAISLYNKAYITINLQENEYINDAIQFLSEAKEAIDVHISEWSITMASCKMAAAASMFEPHHNGETNMKRQLDIRANLLDTWVTNIEKSLEILQKVKDGNDNIKVKARPKGIFALIETSDPLTDNELRRFYKQGLHLLFDLEGKPNFNWSAMICACTGVLEIIAGIVVSIVTAGAGSALGICLIQEGISDIITGISGIVTGNFNWAEWAIAKSMNMGAKLLSTGLHALHGKSESQNPVQKETDENICKLFDSESQQATMTSVNIEQDVQKNWVSVLRNIGTELVSNTEFIAMADKGTEKLFEMAATSFTTPLIHRVVKRSSELNQCLTQFIDVFGILEKCSSPKVLNKEELEDNIIYLCRDVMADVLTDSGIFGRIASVISLVSDQLDTNGRASTTANFISHKVNELTEVVKSIPTKRLMKEDVIPELIIAMNTFMEEETTLGECKCQNVAVPDLNNALLNVIADEISEEFISACTGNVANMVKSTAGAFISRKVNSSLENKMHQYRSERSNFYKQQETYDIKRFGKTNGSQPSPVPTNIPTLKTNHFKINRGLEISTKEAAFLELDAQADSDEDNSSENEKSIDSEKLQFLVEGKDLREW